MIALAAALTLVLAAIAALHAYWGFGGVWPGRDAADCARHVVGFRGVRAMPGPAASFAVAAAIAVAASIPLIMLGPLGTSASPLPALAALAAAFVFLGRGIAGFTPAWRRLTPEQPFASLDVRYFSPLCLAVGSGLAALAVMELWS